MKTLTKLLVGPQDIVPTRPDFRVRGCLNPAGIRLKDNRIMLFCRIAETPKHGEKYFLAPRFAGTAKTEIIVEKIPRQLGSIHPDRFVMKENIMRLPTISHLRRITLDKSGLNIESVEQKPFFMGLTEDGDFGVEDPRLTKLEGEAMHAMTYVSVSMSSGVSTSLALSRDLEKWERKGIIFRQQNKDAAIFPKKFKGHYAALQRPEGTMIFDKPRIWVSFSKDLQYWGKDKPILSPREGAWDSIRIGAGTVPIKIEDGWLMIYHGVRNEIEGDSDSQKIYSAGAVVFDSNDPAKVIARTPAKEPLFKPEADFEESGFVNKVVFPSAAIPDADKKSLLVYCGAADSCIEVKKMRVNLLLSSLEWGRPKN